MKSSFKPQRFLCFLIAVIVIFAVNAPVFLQNAGALFPVIDETDPPETEPPLTEPPVTEPPVTEPTVTEPTETEPPVTEPIVDPPTEQPDPPTAYVPVTDPPTQYTPPTQQDTPTDDRQQEQTSAPETTTVSNAIPSIIEKYAAVQEFFTDTQLDDQNIASTAKDQNAVHIAGGNVIINDSVISRVNKDSAAGEKSAHYGVGAVILATNGAGFISKTTVNSEAKGASGAFAYGSAKLFLADTSVSTAMNNAPGLTAAETGTLHAWNMTVNTLGQDSPPVSTGAGGGAVVLDGGVYASSGLRSPAVSCADSVSVINAELSAEQSEAAAVANGGALMLCDSNLTGAMRPMEGHEQQWTVLLYQPGKADVNLHTDFYMKGGSLTSKAGGLFYTTNTISNVYLENVSIKPYKNSDFLIRCTANADKEIWGSPMKNGASCNFTAVNQQLEGNVVWDAVSEVSLYVRDGSAFTGAFVKDETVRTGKGFADFYLGEGCAWTVAGDSVLTNLHNAGTIADTSGNPVTIRKADGSVIAEGTSAYTIVVSSYDENADMSGAQKAPDWSKVSVARPAALGASLAQITTEQQTEFIATPTEPDKVYERRKAVAVYVLIGVGVIAVGAGVFWLYQANKYKLQKLVHGQR